MEHNNFIAFLSISDESKILTKLEQLSIGLRTNDSNALIIVKALNEKLQN